MGDCDIKAKILGTRKESLTKDEPTVTQKGEKIKSYLETTKLSKFLDIVKPDVRKIMTKPLLLVDRIRKEAEAKGIPSIISRDDRENIAAEKTRGDKVDELMEILRIKDNIKGINDVLIDALVDEEEDLGNGIEEESYELWKPRVVGVKAGLI